RPPLLLRLRWAEGWCAHHRCCPGPRLRRRCRLRQPTQRRRGRALRRPGPRRGRGGGWATRPTPPRPPAPVFPPPPGPRPLPVVRAGLLSFRFALPAAPGQVLHVPGDHAVPAWPGGFAARPLVPVLLLIRLGRGLRDRVAVPPRPLCLPEPGRWTRWLRLVSG